MVPRGPQALPILDSLPPLGLRACHNVPVWAAVFCGCGIAQGLFMIIVLPDKFLPLSRNVGSARCHTGS